jgi:hypothetical protein
MRKLLEKRFFSFSSFSFSRMMLCGRRMQMSCRHTLLSAVGHHMLHQPSSIKHPTTVTITITITTVHEQPNAP